MEATAQKIDVTTTATTTARRRRTSLDHRKANR